MENGGRQKAGIFTVFISLILTATLAFVCMIGEAVRITGGRMMIRETADSAMDSLFSEYHRQLMESYGVFFISGAYDKGFFSGENLTERMKEYMGYNLRPESGGLLLKNMDFWRLTVTDCRLVSYTAATDHDCGAYRRQAADSMKNSVAGALLEKLRSWEEAPYDLDQITKDFEKRESDSEQEIRQLEEAAKEENKSGGAAGALPDPSGQNGSAGGQNGSAGGQNGSAGGQDGEEAFNPITFIRQLKERGILSTVLPSSQAVSDRQIPSSGLVSNRELSVGDAGDIASAGAAQAVTEKILFHEYLMDKCSCFTEEKPLSLPEGKALQYELEYLAAGKNSDTENLKTVVHRLLLLREAVNFACLMTDSVKQLQAETAALAITGLAGIAPLSKATKYGILLAWAYGESIMDVRNLLAGGTAAPVKTEATWQLSLADLGRLVTDFPVKGSVQEGGLDYVDYIRILLFAEKEKTLTLRSLDLIEQNMQRQPGNQGFLADALICRAKITVDFRMQPLFLSFRFMGKGGYRYTDTIQASGAYMEED